MIAESPSMPTTIARLAKWCQEHSYSYFFVVIDDPNAMNSHELDEERMLDPS